MSAAGRRGLYPEIEPFAAGWLPTGGLHEIYYEECGAPAGKPAVVLHGGPGGAINPTMRRFFDPVALAGGAVRPARLRQEPARTPRLQDNTTWTLIEDIERLRKRLGVAEVDACSAAPGARPWRWPTPSRHPERVEDLVLRGVFLLTERELDWFYQDGASMLFPDAWERFCAPIPPAERGDMIGAYHRRLTHADRRVQAEAAAAWSQWEGDTISLARPRGAAGQVQRGRLRHRLRAHRVPLLRQPRLLRRGRLDPEEHPPDRGHPRLDRAGPLRRGHADGERLGAEEGLARRPKFEIIWDAGHASTEPGIIDALVRATDQALA